MVNGTYVFTKVLLVLPEFVESPHLFEEYLLTRENCNKTAALKRGDALKTQLQIDFWSNYMWSLYLCIWIRNEPADTTEE